VSVVELGKGVRVVQEQQLGVRLLRPFAHTLYMTAQRRMCHITSQPGIWPAQATLLEAFSRCPHRRTLSTARVEPQIT
jgi:hypothetical protein